MERPPERQHRILGRRRLLRLAGQGALLCTGALATFVYGFELRQLSFEDARTMLFSGLVLVQLLHVYNVRAEGSSLRARAGTNPFLAVSIAASILLHGLVVYTPVGNELFETTPIGVIDLAVLISIAIVTFLAGAIAFGTLTSR